MSGRTEYPQGNAEVSLGYGCVCFCHGLAVNAGSFSLWQTFLRAGIGGALSILVGYAFVFLFWRKSKG